MKRIQSNMKSALLGVIALSLLVVFAVWMHGIPLLSSCQQAGWINFSLGFVLLAAFLLAQFLQRLNLPLISGYILVGILAGPYVSGFLTVDMVKDLQLIDDLALSFIALSAGGALHLNTLKARAKAIVVNIVLQTVVLFTAFVAFIVFLGRYFDFMRHLSTAEVIGLSILLGVIAVARSPSSAMAIISETRAKGPFTETLLGVTIAMDVLIIIFFTLALSMVKNFVMPTAGSDGHFIWVLPLEMGASLFIGACLGTGIAYYIKTLGHDLALFLLLIAFAVTKLSHWLYAYMDAHYHVALNLEPLLICMAAGFFVQNFSNGGQVFEDSLDQMALPIYVLFFSVAGAALNLNALKLCALFACCLAGLRMLGIFISTWTAGVLIGEPVLHRRVSWMVYLTQAGVSIGLAQLAQRQFPEIGVYLTTLVLAVITINQLIGPVTMKLALTWVKETHVR